MGTHTKQSRTLPVRLNRPHALRVLQQERPRRPLSIARVHRSTAGVPRCNRFVRSKAPMPCRSPGSPCIGPVRVGGHHGQPPPRRQSPPPSHGRVYPPARPPAADRTQGSPNPMARPTLADPTRGIATRRHRRSPPRPIRRHDCSPVGESQNRLRGTRAGHDLFGGTVATRDAAPSSIPG